MRNDSFLNLHTRIHLFEMLSKFLFMELFALFKLFEVIYELRESNLMEIKFGPF